MRSCLRSHGLRRGVPAARPGDDHPPPEVHALLADAARRVKEVAEQVRLSGVMLVTDHGEVVHRRMIGLKG